jgi:DMSO/TMAO reductase YedYZ molybdopterin-dependent catalytic subunit
VRVTEAPTPSPAPGRVRLPWWVAALVGVLSLGAALALGQLVAGLLNNSEAAPYLAVGETFIDHVSAPLKEFAVRSFGADDKAVLLAGMGVVLLGFGVLAGLLARRRPQPGLVLATVLGAVGIFAVLTRGGVGPLDVLAPITSLIAGVAIFALLHRLALTWTLDRQAEAAAAASEPSTPDERPEQQREKQAWQRPAAERDQGALADRTGRSRRKFLASSAGVAVGAGVVAIGGNMLTEKAAAAASRSAVGPLVATHTAPAIPLAADFASTGTPTYLTGNGDFYRIDTELTVPSVRAEDWSLKIHGLVDREVTFGYADIRNRPLTEQLVTLCCVSNPVGGPYISNARWIGVPIADLLAEAGVRPGADQVLSTSVDGWTAGTPVDMLTDPNVGALLAIGMNGQPLPIEHGFPARMVVPGLYGYVSATKWVVDLKLTTFATDQAYWVPRGYAQQAPVKTESRIDVPTAFAQVKAGSVPIAGIAWAQGKGIEKVEVSLDNGPWQPAQLSTLVSKNTWRMWRVFLDLKPGTHTVRARATDATGYTQTAEAAGTVPDGASGYPSVQFTVS